MLCNFLFFSIDKPLTVTAAATGGTKKRSISKMYINTCRRQGAMNRKADSCSWMVLISNPTSRFRGRIIPDSASPPDSQINLQVGVPGRVFYSADTCTCILIIGNVHTCHIHITADHAFQRVSHPTGKRRRDDVPVDTLHHSRGLHVISKEKERPMLAEGRGGRSRARARGERERKRSKTGDETCRPAR